VASSAARGAREAGPSACTAGEHAEGWLPLVGRELDGLNRDLMAVIANHCLAGRPHVSMGCDPHVAAAPRLVHPHPLRGPPSLARQPDKERGSYAV